MSQGKPRTPEDRTTERRGYDPDPVAVVMAALTAVGVTLQVLQGRAIARLTDGGQDAHHDYDVRMEVVQFHRALGRLDAAIAAMENFFKLVLRMPLDKAPWEYGGSGFEFDPRPSTLTVSYTNVQGGKLYGAYQGAGSTLNWLDGNINADPLFYKDSPAFEDNPRDRLYTLDQAGPSIDTPFLTVYSANHRLIRAN